MTRTKSIGREYVEALLVAVVMALFVRTWVAQAFKIPTGSMEQRLMVGDHIVANKFIYGPSGSALERRLLPLRELRRGDVVVFKYPLDPGRDFIKRCVGLPGDEVRLVDKRLSVNGVEVDESAYAYFSDDRVYRSRFVDQSFRLRDNFGPYTVPAESYFCLGDHRDRSRDSRYWGPVPRSHLRGRALMVYWSVATEPVLEEDAPRGALGRAWAALERPFVATRWERSFRLVR